MSLRECDVIAATINGATRNAPLIAALQPKIIIVEEAGEILEPLLLGVLQKSVQHMILIGDHQQLQPKTSDFLLGQRFRLNISLFQRLVERDVRYKTLSIQRRMHPQISEIIRPIYDHLEDFAAVKDYPEVKGVSKRLWFLTHQNPEGTDEHLLSKQNDMEAEFLIRLGNYLLQQGYNAQDLALIAPYLGQVINIKRKVQSGVSKGKLLPGLASVKVSSIDDVQGEEFLIVLLSLVRSPASEDTATSSGKAIGFVRKENRINVALSRAKHGMYVVGNLEHFSKYSPMWENLLRVQQSYGRVGPELELVCAVEGHSCAAKQAIYTKVSTGSDFDAVIDGGCKNLCATRREDCGHACRAKCHAVSHDSLPCFQECQRGQLRPCGHRCPRMCYECKGKDGCAPCQVRVTHDLPCGHKAEGACFEDPAEILCSQPCTRSLPCGHRCRESCKDKCTTRCKVPMKMKLPCGHEVIGKCFQEPKEVICSTPCGALLSCKHPCPGSCGTCESIDGGTFRFHKLCMEECGRPLICGHNCTEPCTKSCPPCELACERFCGHSKCGKTCKEICTPCAEPCVWTCKHDVCELTCEEVCVRERCEEPCEVVLKCGCHCLGMCGEVCPQVCLKHTPNAKVFDENVMQTTLKDCGVEQRFLQLECACAQIVAVEVMDKYIDTLKSEPDVRLPRCMFCKSILWRYPLRYSPTFKAMQLKVDKIKRKIAKAFAARKQVAKKLQAFCKNAYDALPEEALPVVSKWLFLLQSRFLVGKLVRRFSGQNLQHFERICHLCLDLESLRIECLPAVIPAETVELADRSLKQILGNIDMPPTDAERIEGEIKAGFLRVLKAAKQATEEALKAFMQERKMTTEALGYGRASGHWLEHSCGYIYLIVDCGGATRSTKCPECGGTLGGRGHQLAVGNRRMQENDWDKMPS